MTVLISENIDGTYRIGFTSSMGKMYVLPDYAAQPQVESTFEMARLHLVNLPQPAVSTRVYGPRLVRRDPSEDVEVYTYVETEELVMIQTDQQLVTRIAEVERRMLHFAEMLQRLEAERERRKHQ